MRGSRQVPELPPKSSEPYWDRTSDPLLKRRSRSVRHTIPHHPRRGTTRTSACCARLGWGAMGRPHGHTCGHTVSPARHPVQYSVEQYGVEWRRARRRRPRTPAGPGAQGPIRCGYCSMDPVAPGHWRCAPTSLPTGVLVASASPARTLSRFAHPPLPLPRPTLLREASAGRARWAGPRTEANRTSGGTPIDPGRSPRPGM
jgi:hypothetical protein